MTRQRIVMVIEGLGCGGGGALMAERALARLPGVLYAYVNPATEMAYIDYDPERVEQQQLVTAVQRVGFRPGSPSVR